MRVAGIIAEFNPFHKGHRHLIDEVRSQGDITGIVAVMSGQFVQRGEPAMWNKWTRAACAVKNGVDVVLELPTCFAVNSGEYFARGGLSVLKGTGVVTEIAFGSESGSRSDLHRLADALSVESETFSDTLREALSRGWSYPASYEEAAVASVSMEEERIRTLLRSPNDVLALEYIKQAKVLDASFRFSPVRRIGAGHDERGREEVTSASHIRDQIRSGEPFEKWSRYVPEETAAYLQHEPHADARSDERYALLVRYALLTTPVERLSQLLSISEGLEHRLKRALSRSSTTQELIRAVKTKRYTHARICRILVQLLLDLDRDRFRRVCGAPGLYIRVLAMNELGAELLRAMQDGAATVPILNDVTPRSQLEEAAQISLSWDVAASDLYSLIHGESLYEGSDYVRHPVVLF